MLFKNVVYKNIEAQNCKQFDSKFDRCQKHVAYLKFDYCFLGIISRVPSQSFRYDH